MDELRLLVSTHALLDLIVWSLEWLIESDYLSTCSTAIELLREKAELRTNLNFGIGLRGPRFNFAARLNQCARASVER